MPTPYGSRGGLAFGAEELRVLRRALALALHPGPVSAEDIQDCHRLAESLDEAMHEAARLRAFLVADLGRYRAALPGTAAGYLALLEEVLATGYRPDPDDLAALRALRGNPAGAALLERCQTLAEQDVRARLARRTARRAPAATATVPASRTRLLALPGGLSEEAPVCVSAGSAGSAAGADPGGRPQGEPRKKPAGKPATPGPGPVPAEPASPEPARRPVPTPGEVFPRRRPTPPPADPDQRRLAAG
ncbi:putative RNase H-like HicB family nuclease [Streptomyces sp. B4I13]|nr:putative RNase H-like HicB family nuclease [Streptomyces sp. B4I13]